MRHIDLRLIENLHKEARPQRAHEVHCLIQRAVLWLRTRFLRANAALLSAPGCEPA
jgi:hypothetical protein